jgi:hypothetical protein
LGDAAKVQRTHVEEWDHHWRFTFAVKAFGTGCCILRGTFFPVGVIM